MMNQYFFGVKITDEKKLRYDRYHPVIEWAKKGAVIWIGQE